MPRPPPEISNADSALYSLGRNARIRYIMAKSNTIALPNALIAKLQRLAQAQRRSTEEVLAEAVERYIALTRRERLYAYGESQAEKLGLRQEDVPGLVKESRLGTERGRS